MVYFDFEELLQFCHPQYIMHENLETKGFYISSSRGGEVASRRAHNPEIAGANPAPATILHFSEGCHSKL